MSIVQLMKPNMDCGFDGCVVYSIIIILYTTFCAYFNEAVSLNSIIFAINLSLTFNETKNMTTFNVFNILSINVIYANVCVKNLIELNFVRNLVCKLQAVCPRKCVLNYYFSINEMRQRTASITEEFVLSYTTKIIFFN